MYDENWDWKVDAVEELQPNQPIEDFVLKSQKRCFPQ